jgi:hypothetical protein
LWRIIPGLCENLWSLFFIIKNKRERDIVKVKVVKAERVHVGPVIVERREVKEVDPTIDILRFIDQGILKEVEEDSKTKKRKVGEVE